MSNQEYDAARHKQLVKAALDVQGRAYAPHSNFRVGAAIETVEGQIYVGCNVENASYGLTICAERNAVANAVANGGRNFSALAVATANGAAPCGACRQVLAEFGKDLLILLINSKRPDQIAVRSLDQLLPDRCDSRFLRQGD